MNITKRKVMVIKLDRFETIPEDWDSAEKGNVTWRWHNMKLLVERAKTLVADEKDVYEFQEAMNKYAKSIGFGSAEAIGTIALEIYG